MCVSECVCVAGYIYVLKQQYIYGKGLNLRLNPTVASLKFPFFRVKTKKVTPTESSSRQTDGQTDPSVVGLTIASAAPRTTQTTTTFIHPTSENCYGTTCELLP